MSGFLKQIAEAGGFKTEEASSEEKDKQAQQQQQQNQQDPPPTEDEILLASYNKRFGKDFKSLDEINNPPAAQRQQELTEAEKLAAAQKKKDDAVAFGLTKGKLKSNELSEYAKIDGMSARDFKFQQFKNKRLAADKDLSDEEIENDFKDYYHEHAEVDDWKRQAINNRWEKEKQAYLQKNFGHINSIESEYDQYLQDTQGKEQHSKRVDALVANMPKEKVFEWSEEGADKKPVPFSHSFKISEQVINEVATEFKNEGLYQVYKASGAKDEEIQAAIENKIFLKERDRILKEVANAHADKKIAAIKMGRLGIPPNRNEPSGAFAGGGQGGFLSSIYENRPQKN